MKCKLFRDVPFARVGNQDYALSELGQPGSGMASVTRPADEVRRSAPSFEGVPITVRHPGDLLNSRNLDELIVGMASAVRFDGSTEQLRADLIVWDPEAIMAIADGLRELSAGYDADYEPTAGGFMQRNIRGNHIALVEAGRSGSAQRIGA